MARKLVIWSMTSIPSQTRHWDKIKENRRSCLKCLCCTVKMAMWMFWLFWKGVKEGQKEFSRKCFAKKSRRVWENNGKWVNKTVPQSWVQKKAKQNHVHEWVSLSASRNVFILTPQKHVEGNHSVTGKLEWPEKLRWIDLFCGALPVRFLKTPDRFLAPSTKEE